MDYELIVWLLAGFMVGRISKKKFYIGPDKQKYDDADFGIQTGGR